MDMMQQDVSEMKNVCTPWADTCGGDVVSNSFVTDVMNQENNTKSINAQELEEHER